MLWFLPSQLPVSIIQSMQRMKIKGRSLSERMSFDIVMKSNSGGNNSHLCMPDRPVHAIAIAVQLLTLHEHQQNMHTSVLPVFVVESAWAHWPNFPQLARLVGDQQSSPPISPNWAYQSIHSLHVSIFLFPPSVPRVHRRTPECRDRQRGDVGAPFVFER